MRPSLLLSLSGALLLPAAALAQLRPPAGGNGIGEYTLHDFAAKWLMQQDDLAETARYAEANRTLLMEADRRARIVFIGDSITEHWKTLEPRSDRSIRLVNRGISGSNTSQMLLRFEDDAIGLSPSVVVLMGGTNDLRAYVGDPAGVGEGAFRRITRNLTAMVDIAKGRGVRVILCGIPPVGRDLDRIARDPVSIRRINAWLAGFARARRISFVDYAEVLGDAEGFMKAEFSTDGIHPNDAGYAAMWPLVARSLPGSRP